MDQLGWEIIESMADQVIDESRKMLELIQKILVSMPDDFTLKTEIRGKRTVLTKGTQGEPLIWFGRYLLPPDGPEDESPTGDATAWDLKEILSSLKYGDELEILR